MQGADKKFGVRGLQSKSGVEPSHSETLLAGMLLHMECAGPQGDEVARRRFLMPRNDWTFGGLASGSF